MICKSCRDGDHERCDGVTRHPTYCDCHHRPGFTATIKRLNEQMLAALHGWWIR